MEGFDMGGLMGMLGNVQQKMQEMKEKAAQTEVEGTASGGLVRIKMTCDHQVTAVMLSQDAMEDRELLEDLIRAATNEALRKIQEETAKNMSDVTGGLPIPPGILPGFP